jgi:hypothetical protein
MTTFHDFTSWLFPGDPVRNPSSRDLDVAWRRTPAEAKTILEQVACETGVRKEWLAESVGLVLRGLAGLRCLWFLHGARGEIVAEGKGQPNEPRLADELEQIRLRETHFDAKANATIHVTVDWLGGTATEMLYGPRVPPKPRVTKLGKWLKKKGASPELLHAFETRDLPAWKWEISCHPFDVLTMSHQRPWTSCMRPGGVHELGPLTDMAAGTAVLFFRRPGAAQPCGRTLLRPVDMDGIPAVVGAEEIYGCGPEHLFEDALHDALSPFLGGVVFDGYAKLCGLGAAGHALTRYIYSDTDVAGCQQTDEAYEEAYKNLAAIDWPGPRLATKDLADIRVAAEAALPTVSDAPTRRMLADIAREITESYVQTGTVHDIEQTYEAVVAGDIPTYEDLRNSDLPEDISTMDDVQAMMLDRLKEMKRERLESIESEVIIIRKPEGPDTKQTREDIRYAMDGLRIEILGKAKIDRMSHRILSFINKACRIILTDSYYTVTEDDSIWLLVAVPLDDLGDDERGYGMERLKSRINAAGVLLANFTLPAGVWDFDEDI